MTRPLEPLAQGLGALLGATVSHVRPLATESRNSIARVTLEDGDGRRTAILKTYDAKGDPHWANRCRREEKTLTLLAGMDPPVAPRPIAAFLPARGPAALLMEDAGERSLADALTAGGEALWPEAARFLSRLHAATEEARLPLKRTAMSISLDRINGPVLLRRMRIAGERILGRPPEYSAQRAMRVLVAPLLAAPKAIVHNSLSPLNIVLGPDGWRAIDWETLTVASPVWDWAELLRGPFTPLPLDASERLMVEATGADPEAGRDLFRRAALSRHLDSLATVVQRCRRYEAESRCDRAAEYRRRAQFYAGDLKDLAARLDPPPQLAAWLRAVWETALE